jgi:hypothetical protein
MADHCSVCAFACPHAFVQGRNLLQCRRHAPGAAQAGELRGFATWPLVEMDEWCGDFQRRNPVQAEGANNG